MAQYRILDGGDLNDRVTGFAYTAVPAGNNAAATSWQQVVAEYVTRTHGATTSRAPALPAGVSQAELDSGAKFEWEFTVEFDANLTDLGKRSAVETVIAAREAELVTHLQNRLRFWGFEGVTS